MQEKHISRFIFASLITSYPDAAFKDDVLHLIRNAHLGLSEKGLSYKIEKVLTDENTLNDLRSEYIDIFDRGKISNPLYETEYGRERAMFKATELADLAGFYKAWGFELSQDGHEMLDHVSVELEFYALLCMKEKYLLEKNDNNGVRIVLDSRAKFLKDHLGRFIGAILERPGVSQSEFYSEVFTWCDKLVSEECKALKVEVTPAQWVLGQSEPETYGCSVTPS